MAPYEPSLDTSPRKLLHGFTLKGLALVTWKRESGERVAPAKGHRGLKRAAKKRRRAQKMAQERRVTLRSFTVQEQREKVDV